MTDILLKRLKKTLFLGLSFFSVSVFAQKGKMAEAWLTDPKAEVLFKKQASVLASQHASAANIIEINPNKRYQTIDGFGYTLTGGSAGHLLKMSPQARKKLLEELFAFDKENIGTSYLRLSVGASDLNDFVFSYDDLPDGETDVEMKKFDLGQDKKDVIPVLKEILTINPKIKLMGSPWSPPKWMKTNNDTRGGSLKPEFYDAYALYLVKYIQEMAKEGVIIDALTVQNEPLHPGNNPSLLMLAKDQAEFVKNHLGPAFQKHKVKTKVIIYDHNADKPEYPIEILNDPNAKKYIDGSAFHLYGGTIDALSKVKEAHPDKNLYFTEQWFGAPGNLHRDFVNHIQNLTIGATRNWSKTVLEWNITSNSELTPFTDRGGCSKCLGAVTVDGDVVKRNPAYYTVAQAAKFVRPGSVRIESNLIDGLPNVAFKTPSGKIVIIVLNNSKEKRDFSVKNKNAVYNSSLNAGAAVSLIF
ncbi:Glucan endo-1,6-beta-glucosidase [Pseudopedobacter saltans DSM 12145]|uniref:Glucan endo-1,6-beta-glucosidase n=1 Tax=Pseudopedobacter saltans (strain ATCC 51119 / DSM 12145 / JCM 21818 / CCUG 39354 / LMG 10337 / NBRC 100064 / NCIMB 13643) TaxID=762903 RepID=F0SA53_PSESL|nr:glycoside hydrolase family 30 beta sandwich domain-containing protein [Pseudopedobacter saltans]ADY53617.1 Glucan endo-1,6-beta-glucosidase [Pseudopedobacter saltans DSM 12145]